MLGDLFRPRICFGRPLNDRTDEGFPITVPQLLIIDTQKVLIIGFQNAHGAHPTDAHDKWVEAMANAEALQIVDFGLSELNTNEKFPLYERLVKAIINGDLGQRKWGLIDIVAEIVEVITTMLNEIQQNITE